MPTDIKEVIFEIEPLHDRVIVRPDKAEEVTKGGIILAPTAQERPLRGEVLAAGPGMVTDQGTLLKTVVKKGQRILYGKYGGTDIEVAGETLLIMREVDILGVINSSKPEPAEESAA